MDQLRAAYPAWEIDTFGGTEVPRYCAAARDLATALHTVITADLAEMEAILAEALRRSGGSP